MAKEKIASTIEKDPIKGLIQCSNIKRLYKKVSLRPEIRLGKAILTATRIRRKGKKNTLRLATSYHLKRTSFQLSSCLLTKYYDLEQQIITNYIVFHHST